MVSMVYNWLGSSGLRVSNICLGTMNFGRHGQGRPSCEEADAHRVLDEFAGHGGNFIDTADMYQYGGTETIIGKWMAKQKRDKLILATKLGRPMDHKDPNSGGLNRKHIMDSVQNSLKRLQTNYLDIYYIHVWDAATPLEESLSALNDLVTQGTIRYVGMSNATGWQLQKMVDMSHYRGWQPIIGLQNQYNLLCRSVELEVTDVCKNEGVGFLPWSPLKGGWLSGKVRRGATQATEGSRMAWAQGRAHHSHPDFDWFSDKEQVWNILDKLENIATMHDRTVAQVAVRWLLQKQGVPSVVVGPRTLEQLQDNMAAATGWTLTTEQMMALDEVSAGPIPYPYDYIELANRGRLRS